MERQTKMRKKEKEISEKRSPSQRLNGLQIRKPNCKKNSNLSSGTVSCQVPNACPRLLRSSNSSSASSSSSSYSKTQFKKPTIANNPSLRSFAVTLKPRSKENEVPQKPFSQKFMKKQPPGIDKKQFGKANTKPTIKNAQRSDLCPVQKHPAKIFKKGSENIAAKLKNSEESGSGESKIKLIGVASNIYLNSIENHTPKGKIGNACGLDCVSFDYPQNVEEGSISKGKNSDNAVKTPPVEASVSPEIQCGTHSKIPIAKSAAATPVCYGAGHILSGVTDKRKCRRRGSLKGGCEKINLFDDEKNCENVIRNSWDSLVPLPGEASVHWVLSPCDKLEQCKIIGESDAFVGSDYGYAKKMHEQENNVGHDMIKDDSALSLGSLSSGNIIQTPSSDTSSYGCLKGLDVDFIQFELDSVSKTMDNVSNVSLNQVQENVDSVCSWVSDSTLENLTLSQTRVSWKDGFDSRIDEFDCCRCLSDEEIDADVCSDKELCPLSQSGGKKENDVRIFSDEYEPCISARGDEKLLSRGMNASAESICTNGGGLVASGDSDWMYFREK